MLHTTSPPPSRRVEGTYRQVEPGAESGSCDYPILVFMIFSAIAVLRLLHDQPFSLPSCHFWGRLMSVGSIAHPAIVIIDPGKWQSIVVQHPRSKACRQGFNVRHGQKRLARILQASGARRS